MMCIFNAYFVYCRTSKTNKKLSYRRDSARCG